MKIKYLISIIIIVFCGGVFASFANETYEYDNIGRLLNVTYDDGSQITYTYDDNGNITSIESPPVSVGDALGKSAFELTCSPNPFDNNTNISFNVPPGLGNKKAEINIYDISGALITILNNQSLSEGLQSISWNGTDLNGNDVVTGIYLCKLKIGKFSITEKIVFNK